MSIEHTTEVLVVIPMQEEVDCFLQGCAEQGLESEGSEIGRLSVTRLPAARLTVACGGLGKTQFAVQTQHLIDAGPIWKGLVCAGAAGALADDLAVGDVVVGTETVEYDIQNRFGPPLVPRFRTSEALVEAFKSLPVNGGFAVHFGPIASGDEDVVERDRRQAIRVLTGALVAAWEGAGAARACQFSAIPFVEIRGITDSANDTAALDFRENLKRSMHNVARLIASWTKRDWSESSVAQGTQLP